MNNQKRIFREKFPTNPQNLTGKFGNSDEGNCMLEKRTICKSSEIIVDMKLDFSSEINCENDICGHVETNESDDE